MDTDKKFLSSLAEFEFTSKKKARQRRLRRERELDAFIKKRKKSK